MTKTSRSVVRALAIAALLTSAYAAIQSMHAQTNTCQTGWSCSTSSLHFSVRQGDAIAVLSTHNVSTLVARTHPTASPPEFVR